ncbi:hypothetical protein DPMN_109117, partial [Dreissena polymorpha]
FDVQRQHRVAIREHWVKFYDLNTVRRGPPYPTWSTLLLHVIVACGYESCEELYI